MGLAEMKTLRYSAASIKIQIHSSCKVEMDALARLDRIRNEHIRGNIRVAGLEIKVKESTLKWLGHVRRIS